MTKLLNTESIRDEPNFYKLMQVHISEEEQSMVLSKEAQCVLYLLYNTDHK